VKFNEAIKSLRPPWLRPTPSKIGGFFELKKVTIPTANFKVFLKGNATSARIFIFMLTDVLDRVISSVCSRGTLGRQNTQRQAAGEFFQK